MLRKWPSIVQSRRFIRPRLTDFRKENWSTKIQMKVLYIVRTFSPVGGMERYVYETALAMASKGHSVGVLCRSLGEASSPPVGVDTTLLSLPRVKRGWQDRAFFAGATADVLSQTDITRRYDIIHSHENTWGQHVSTEHGPCTKAGLRRSPWKVFDYSALRNLLLEKSKFRAPPLVGVAFCSRQVECEILREYPPLGNIVRSVIPPAFAYFSAFPKTKARRKTIGFIGADWKRKGLLKALEIFRAIKLKDDSWTMVVAGVEAVDLPDLILSRLKDGVSVIGRVEAVDFFSQIDVLLHPAREEPFGMVIAEALSLGIPVVVSGRCGCLSHLDAEGISMVDLRESSVVWAERCLEFSGKRAHLRSLRSWSDVAADHESLYEQILSSQSTALASRS